MKKYILILGFAFIALNATAQQVDTVKNAVQVKPIVINALQKDTLYQFKVDNFWMDIYDTTSANTYVVYYNRKAGKVGEENIKIPYAVFSSGVNSTLIDNYILTFLGLQKR